MSISRLLSLLVAGIYVLIAYFGGPKVAGFTSLLGAAFVLGLPCIWFGDALGSMLGPMGHGRIDTRTPEAVVRFLGWLLLLFLPILGYILCK